MTKDQYVKHFIRAVRRHDNKGAKLMLAEVPDLINAVASAPPRKDDGQSPLQIAFKTGNFAMAKLLLDKGADPTFMEQSSLNDWRAPVLHDAIQASLMTAVDLYGTGRNPTAGLRLVKRLLLMGADPNRPDSFGNTPAMRALLDSRQIITHPMFNRHSGAVRHARRVIKLLHKHGADFDLSVGLKGSPRAAEKRLRLQQYKLLPPQTENVADTVGERVNA